MEQIIAKKTLPADLKLEMQQSYLDYAMSVIVGRALPDVRDGLKPVHRRILYAMMDLGNDWNKQHKKSARVTGDVIGKYHPHGDTAIYDAIVRMAQEFSMRYPLIDGQGNFGSVDGDSAAAMRYTEVRLSRIAHELLSDIEKNTVNFVPNYDETETQPVVLPARLPNLLLNGSEGIAVGMATKIPPHNLSETVSACLALIHDDSHSISDLMEYLPGPDFPTAGIINGRSGIISAYHTGRGSVRLRGKVEIESTKKGKRQSLIITELPYQVLKAPLIEHIAKQVKAGVLDGISMVRDESDKSGMRVVIELKAGVQPDVVENNLYNHTRLENSYGINLVALENNQPRLFNLKEMLTGFLRHRREVVTRRLEFELQKAEERAHILEGFTVALSNLDRIITTIRAASSRPEAKIRLLEIAWDPEMVLNLLESSHASERQSSGSGANFGVVEDGYLLTETQVDAILELRLHRLTSMEQEKVFEEFQLILALIDRTKQILRSPELLMEEIHSELVDLRDQYGKNDERRTEIMESELDLNNEDLIQREAVVVTISHEGYAKQQPLSDYRAQNRGGKGKTATTHKEDDFVSRMFVASTHNTLLCFTNTGKVFWTKVYKLQRASRTARGRPLVNVLPSLAENEKVTAVLPIYGYEDGKYIIMSTRLGRIKKCEVESFSRPRSNGIRAINLQEGDELVNVGLTDGTSHILLISNFGRAVRFCESDIRAMGRTAAGVRGIKLEKNQHVITMILIDSEDDQRVALLVSSDGQGKRTKLSEFPQKSRATKGVYVLPKKKRDNTTEMVDALIVGENDEIVMITDGGTLIRTQVSAISTLSRSTGGVRLIKLNEGESLVGVASISDNGVGNDDADETEEIFTDTDAADSNNGSN